MLRHHLKSTSHLAILIDLMVTIFSYLITFTIRSFMIQLYPFGGAVTLADFILLLPAIVIIWGILLKRENKPNSLRYPTFSNELKKIIRTISIGILIIIALAFGFNVNTLPRTLIGVFSVVNFSLLALEKYLFIHFLKEIRKLGRNRKSVVIVGANGIASQFLDSMYQNDNHSLNIVGFLDNNQEKLGTPYYGSRVIGKLDDLPQVLHNNYVEEVIFTLPSSELEKSTSLFTQCETEGVQTSVVSNFFTNMIGRAETEIIQGRPIITYHVAPRRARDMVIKRTVDLVVSSIALFLLSPLFAIISILIKLTSPGPVFYRWHVLGLNKKKFVGYKFRTMVENADELKQKLMEQNEMQGAAFKMKEDPRITRVGKFLRKYSLDELPQLYSVFKGDMSLVGPRPPLVSEMEKFADWHRRKLSVKPGITCIWQSSGRNKISDFDEWVKLDLQYIDNWSLWLDFKIMLKTIPAVLRGSGA